MGNHNNCLDSDIYFTIIPTKSGFTDQLQQFIGLYRLGDSLGYKYYHTDLKSHRSKYNPFEIKLSLISKIKRKFQFIYRSLKKIFPVFRGFEVFDFIGINQYFRENSSYLSTKEPDKLELKITNELISDNAIKSSVDLKNYVNRIVHKKKSNNILVVFKVGHGRKFINLILSEIHRSKIEKGLIRIYYENKVKSGWTSEFKKDKDIKLLVHIRQGDTAIIKTPWNTFINVFALYEYVQGTFKEFKNRDELKTFRNIEVACYYDFLMKLFSVYLNNPFSTLVFSDGFKRGFNAIYKNLDKLGFTSTQNKLFFKSEKNYNLQIFKNFKNLNDLRTFIGEDNKKLAKLINAFFDADIIVIGTQQTMIPKLLSVYFDLENMPIVVVLYKKYIPHYHYINEEILDKKFVFVDAEKIEIDDVLIKINSQISRSHR